jgi:hypothetical protein
MQVQVLASLVSLVVERRSHRLAQRRSHHNLTTLQQPRSMSIRAMEMASSARRKPSQATYTRSLLSEG